MPEGWARLYSQCNFLFSVFSASAPTCGNTATNSLLVKRTRIDTDLTDSHGFDPRKSVRSVSIRVPQRIHVSRAGITNFHERHKDHKESRALVDGVLAALRRVGFGRFFLRAFAARLHIPMFGFFGRRADDIDAGA